MKPTVVLLKLPEGHAIKFINHREFDPLLCKHVYHNFCQNCPQTKCTQRSL